MKVLVQRNGITLTIWILICIGLIFYGINSHAQQTVKEGYFTIFHDDSFAPFGSAEKDSNGQYKQSTGFEIDLLTKIISNMGLKPSFNPDAWAKVLVSVKVGSADAIATIGITEERKKSYDFSEPYASYAAILFVPQKSSINSLKKLNGKKIGIQKNHFSVPWLRDHYPNVQQVAFENAKDAFLAAIEGNVDGAVADKLVGLYTIKEDPKLIQKIKPVGKEFSSTPVALAFAKGQKIELRKKFNQTLKELKKSNDYSTIFIKWFGVDNK